VEPWEVESSLQKPRGTGNTGLIESCALCSTRYCKHHHCRRPTLTSAPLLHLSKRLPLPLQKLDTVSTEAMSTPSKPSKGKKRKNDASSGDRPKVRRTGVTTLASRHRTGSDFMLLPNLTGLLQSKLLLPYVLKRKFM
jgi:hypothetical protein